MSIVLSVKNVTMRYDGKEALSDVSFDVHGGQIVGLLGPNGSGKTTLIKIINTLITSYQGSVEVSGKPLSAESKTHISYLPDNEYLRSDFKVDVIVRMYSDFYKDFDVNKAYEMLRLVGVNPKAPIRTLSKGMKERVQLVLVMSRKAALYVFDEPIAGVDPAARDFILDTIIRNYNPEGSIMLSTHLISDVEPVISQAIFLREGRVVLNEDADSLRESRGKSIDAIFREEFRC